MKTRVSAFLEVGHDHGRPAREVTYAMNIDRRTMRDLVNEEMTTEGEKFIINLQDGKGYFIPDLTTPEGISDARAYVLQEEARANSVLFKIDRLKKALEEVEANGIEY